jgi:hypothetical protein
MRVIPFYRMSFLSTHLHDKISNKTASLNRTRRISISLWLVQNCKLIPEGLYEGFTKTESATHAPNLYRKFCSPLSFMFRKLDIVKLKCMELVYIFLIRLYSPLVGPWPLFKLTNPIYSRYDSLDGGSARRKAVIYTQNTIT